MVSHVNTVAFKMQEKEVRGKMALATEGDSAGSGKPFPDAGIESKKWMGLNVKLRL
jgi:hypothetical protein